MLGLQRGPEELPPARGGHADGGRELGDRELRDGGGAIPGDLQRPVAEQHVRLIHRRRRQGRGLITGMGFAPLGGELELTGLGEALGAVGDLGGGQQRLIVGARSPDQDGAASR